MDDPSGRPRTAVVEEGEPSRCSRCPVYVSPPPDSGSIHELSRSVCLRRSLRWCDDVRGQEVEVPAEAEHESILPPTLCSTQDPQHVGGCPLALVRATFSPSSTDSDANLFRRHPQTHPEMVLHQLSGSP